MSDYMIRATAANGQIRAFAATTRDLTEYARNAHNTSPVVTAALGRTMTAAVMMGSMLKGDKELLTVKIQGDGPIGSLTVTADSHGHVKGYAQNPVVLIQANSIGKLDVAGAIGKGVLSVIKDIGLKDPYVGQTDLVSGEIAEDLTYYFAVSEQTPSSVGLGVLMNKDNTVRQAGGFIIQLMPDASEETISALEKRLAKVSSVTAMLDSGKTPEDILQELLGDMELAVLDTVTRPCRVVQTGECSFRIILTQGLNRQIRRMCRYLGYEVQKLKRIRIMNLTLDGIREGEYREITAQEWEKLNHLLESSTSETVIRTGEQNGNSSDHANERAGAKAGQGSKGVLPAGYRDHKQQRVRSDVRRASGSGERDRHCSGKQPNRKRRVRGS